jgi:hypothetical protein
MEIINGKLVVQNRKKTDILAELKRRDYAPFAKGQGSTTAGDSPVTPTDGGDESDEDAEVESASNKGAGIRGYDYLLSMPIWNLTLEYVGVNPFVPGVSSLTCSFDLNRSKNSLVSATTRGWSWMRC